MSCLSALPTENRVRSYAAMSDEEHSTPDDTEPEARLTSLACDAVMRATRGLPDELGAVVILFEQGKPGSAAYACTADREAMRAVLIDLMKHI